jgi:sugar phosphate permease
MNKYVYANEVIRTEKIEFSGAQNFTTSKVTQLIELSSPNLWMMGLLIFIQLVFVTMAYGPIAAFLVELFPVQIRYTSMSLPYHIGNGVFGGLTPLIAESLVLQSGNIFAGLYYPITVAFITFIIGAIFIKKSNTFTVNQS